MKHNCFSFFAEAILSSGDEGSLSLESEESDDEPDLTQGRWCFGVLKEGNFGQCELQWPVCCCYTGFLCT